jgi:transcriptional regulator with XRE-family HTH domain
MNTEDRLTLAADASDSCSMTEEDLDLYMGRMLRRRRRLLRMTQQVLAARAKVSFQQIQKYECAHNRMSAARLRKLADALEVPVSYFLPPSRYETLSSASHSSISALAA